MNGFDPERIATLTGGSGLLVGSVTIEGDPHAARAWSTEVVDPDRGRIRVGVCADDPRTVLSIDGRLVAITAADVRTFESVQVKGRAVLTGAPNDHDLSVIDEHTNSFLASVEETDGDPADLLRRLTPNSFAMIELDITEIYDQTPGPGAGAPIGATTGESR